MKRFAIGVAVAVLLPTRAFAQVHVKGYVKRDGTYVAPHYRSSPNGTTLDNYSTKGNYNPYTGKVGTRDLYSNPYGSNSQSRSSSPYGWTSNASTNDDENEPE